MARYIDIDKSIDVLMMTQDFCFCPRDIKEYEEIDCSKYTKIGGCQECWIQHNVEDVAPIIHARWEKNYVANKKVYKKIDGDLVCTEDGTIDLIMCCSNCNHRAFANNGIYVKTPYCSFCGAKMDK